MGTSPGSAPRRETDASPAVRPVRLGLVGLAWGERVASAVRGRPEVRLAACHARTPARRDAFAARHGLRAYATYEQMLADRSLEGVVLMTPNGTHRDLAVEALRAGKHVLVTKPIAPTLAEAAEMMATAAACGRTLAVGHQSRRHPALRRLRQLVDSGDLGELRLIEGNTSSPTGPTLAAGHWRTQAAACPGGPLMQLGIHYIDTFQHLLGPVRSVSAWMSGSPGNDTAPDTTLSLFQFHTGAAGYLGSSYVTAHARWIRLTGTEGAAVFQADGSLRVVKEGRDHVVVPPASDRESVLSAMLAEEVGEFAACIRGGSPPEIDGRVGTRNLAVVLAAVESHRCGEPVSVDGILLAAGIS